MSKNYFYCISGLGDIPNMAIFKIHTEEEEVLIEMVKLKMIGADEVLKTYRLKSADILAADIVREEQLTDKSVIGRGVAGALLLGPVGAVVGGMSGIGKKTKIKELFVISYLPSNSNEPATIAFDVYGICPGPNKKFIAEFKKEISSIEKSDRAKSHLKHIETENGDVIL